MNLRLYYRSSRSEMFFKIGVIKNFVNFTGIINIRVSNTDVFL